MWTDGSERINKIYLEIKWDGLFFIKVFLKKWLKCVF